MAHIKDSRSYHLEGYQTEPSQKTAVIDRVLLFAIIFATLLHAGIIFGITFEAKTSPTTMIQEVATAITQNVQENNQADFIADANHVGGGEVNNKLIKKTVDSSPLTETAILDTDDIIQQRKMQQQQYYQESYLRTTLSWQKVDKKNDNDKDNEANDIQEQQERLVQQIATLEAQLANRKQIYSQKTQVQTVDSTSSQQSNVANYIQTFRRNVETIGNQHYPEAARQQNITGDVRLMVIINSQGNLKAIRLLQSSGSRILDEAAKDSVRQAAPFGRFTSAMIKANVLELRIIRTWRYSNQIEVFE